MANLQHIEMFAGDTRTFTLAGRGATNAPANLAGRAVAWYVGRSPFRPDDGTPIITKTGSVVSAPDGTFTVSLALEDTRDLNGDFEHMALAFINDAQNVITRGRFRILPVLSP